MMRRGFQSEAIAENLPPVSRSRSAGANSTSNPRRPALQNIVASALCYGWGLGLASRLDPGVRVPATIAVYVAVVAVVVAFASLWLRRFDRGPVEWLWYSSNRALTGGR